MANRHTMQELKELQALPLDLKIRLTKQRIREEESIKKKFNIIQKEVRKQIKQLGYNGCRNCQHQIAPLRMCEWAEHGGDGRLHLICPRWDKAESEVRNADSD